MTSASPPGSGPPRLQGPILLAVVVVLLLIVVAWWWAFAGEGRARFRSGEPTPADPGAQSP